MTPIPTLAEWLQRTKPHADTGVASAVRNVLATRSQEVRDIDYCLQEYHRTIDEFTRDRCLNELRINLDAWKLSTGRRWKEDPRNHAGAFSDLDQALCESNYAQPVSQSEDCKLARRYRQDTLFILKSLNLTRIPGGVSDLFDQGKEAVEAVPGLSAALGQAVTSVSGVQQVVDKTTQFLSMLKEQITDFLRYLAEQIVKQMGGLAEIAQNVFNLLKDSIPELLKTLLAGIMQFAGDAISILKDVYKAAKSTATLVRIGHTDEQIKEGSAKIIFDSVKEQIEEYRSDAVYSAAQSAAKIGLSVALPVGGVIIAKVAGAIGAVYGFFKNLYLNIVDRMKVNALIEEAKRKYKNRAYRKAVGFNKWFREAIEKNPVIASYLMSMLGYRFFLTTLTTNGTEIGRSTLVRSYDDLGEIKEWAGEFATGNWIKLSSEHKIIQLKLTQAQGQTPTLTSTGTDMVTSSLWSTATGWVSGALGFADD
jgi:hypothetical protein